MTLASAFLSLIRCPDCQGIETGRGRQALVVRLIRCPDCQGIETDLNGGDVISGGLIRCPDCQGIETAPMTVNPASFAGLIRCPDCQGIETTFANR